MFDFDGHCISFRGPSSQTDALDELGLDPADLAMVIVGEDMGVEILAAFNNDGEVVFRADGLDRVVLANYIAAGRTIASTLQREQDQIIASMRGSGESS